MASAATESAVKLEPMTATAVTAAAAEAPGATAAAVSTAGRISNSKRRKTAPRKLGSFQPSPVHHRYINEVVIPPPSFLLSSRGGGGGGGGFRNLRIDLQV